MVGIQNGCKYTLIYSTKRNTSAGSAWRQYPSQLGLLLVGERAGKHNVKVDPQVAFAAGRLHACACQRDQSRRPKFPCLLSIKFTLHCAAQCISHPVHFSRPDI